MRSRFLRVHIDIYIRCRTCKINKTITIFLMNDLCNFMIRSKDACYIGAGSNCSYFYFSGTVFLQKFFEMGYIDQTFRCRINYFNIPDGLQPACLIGMMLHVCDEYDGAIFFRKRYLVPEFFMDL